MAEHVVTFRQGVGGYSGTVDTQLTQSAPTQSSATASTLGVDKKSDIQVLLKFEDLFGDLASQIPPGAQLISASLTLQITNGGDGASLYRMLTPWSDTSTWSSTGNGIQNNNVESRSTADVVTGATDVGSSAYDVTASVQAWLGGQANHGWVFVSKGSNGWDFQSAQGSAPPQLTIRYSMPDGPANANPVAGVDTVVLNEDTSATISVLGNDTDSDGHTVTLTGVGTPAHGTAVINSNGTITYTAATNYAGTDSFTYTISDGNGGTATGTVNVTVNPINDIPVATNDAVSVNEDSSVVISVLGNDTDADGNALTVTGVSAAAHGTAVINPNGTITYTPGANYAGPDSFTYTIGDGNGGTATGTVNVTVNAFNALPVAANDTATVAEDGSVLINVLTNDSDADGHTLIVTGTSTPAHGTVVFNPNGAITYTPAANYSGPDSFTYTISDGNGGSTTATVNVTVTPVNDNPVAANDTTQVSKNGSVLVTVLGNDTDADGHALTVTGVGTPAHGAVVINSDGTLTYTPTANYVGPDSFSYTISDGNGGTASGTVNVTVNPVNDAPVAANDTATVNEDGTVLISVLGNDTDANDNPLTVTGVGTPAHGAVVINSDGTLTYTPTANYSGPDSFSYTISDGNGGSTSATVSVTVNPVNDNPVAANDTGTVQTGNALTLNLIANDTDVEGNLVSVSGVGAAAHGTVVINPNGTITYTPAGGYTGPDSFSYTISDGNGGTATASVGITVTPPPSAWVEKQVTFRDGVAGYTGTVDTQLAQASPSTSYATTAIIGVDKGTDVQVLLRFEDLFGDLASQVPAGAEILSATLTLRTDNAGDGASLYRMLTPWSDTSTWSSLTNGVQINNVEARSTADLSTGSTSVGNSVFNVTSSIQAWLGGQANYGWVFVSRGSNGWDFFSSEGASANRPQLTITYRAQSGPVNTAPVAVNDSITVNEDTSAVISVLGNDTDADGNTLSVTAVGTPAHGTVVINPNGTLTYTPAANYNGPDSFTYTISDGNGGTATGTVTIGVTAVNDNPVATNDAITVAEDGNVVISVLGNDTDADGHALIVTGVGTPAHGTVVINPNGTISYTPAANYNGTDSFTYTISDGNGGTATGTVNVTVGSVNDAPVATNDSATVGEDGSVAVAVLGNDTDTEGQALTVTAVGIPEHGTAVINSNGTVTYTPFANYNGADSFSYTVSDGNGGSATATVNVTVNPVNDAPTAQDDVAVVNQDESIVVSVLANDSDVDADTLSISAVGVPAHGTAVINSNGTITYTPAAGYFGTDSFTYTVSDGHGGFKTASVDVAVNEVVPVNTPPVATNDAISVNEDGSVEIAVLGNDTDADGHALSVTGTGAPAHGTVVINSNGTITYTPAANYNGADSFTYTISDGNGGTATGTVNVTVNPVNDNPVAANDAVTVNEDTSATISVLGNDTDLDGHTLSLAGVGTPAHGTVVINPNGTITYTPAANYNGPDSFTYTVGDGNGGTATGTVNIAVTPVNDNPVAVNDAITVAEDGSVVVSVLGNDTDADGHGLSVTGVGTPAHGTLVVNSNGTITYTPAANYNGTDSFTYTISDGNGGTATGTVNVTVTPANDAPVAANDTASVNEDNAVVIAVLGNDTDPDGHTLTVTGVGTPAHGTVVINSNGTVTYTPDANYNGTDSFTYTVSDGNGGTSTATANVTINPVADAPVAVNDSGSVQAGNSLVVNVLLNDRDGDGDALSITGVTTGPAHGTVIVNSDGTITYTAANGYSGSDSFMYGISDGNGGTSIATVTINVTDDALSASYVATKLTSGSARNLEHGNASKSFYFDGAWWAVLPNGANWSIHKFEGSTPQPGQQGGWSVASDALFSNSMRSELAWDAVHEQLYVLQYSASNDEPRLLRLTFDEGSQSWEVETNVQLAGDGGVLSGSEWGENLEMGLGLDQLGTPIITAIAAESQGAKGLHVAYATSSDLSTWGSTTIDPDTKGLGGSNGNSKADIMVFTQNGVDKVGIFYSRDGSGSDDDWSFAWHNTSANGSTYGNGWAVEMVTDDVNIDNHMSAVSDGEFIYAVIKDDDDALWLLKGNPGHWETPMLIVDGDGNNPSRPTVVLDETNDQLYIFYQESTSNPEGQIYMKVVDTHNPVFDPESLGILIMEGTTGSHDFLDPQSPAHAVGNDTGGYFLLFAKNEQRNEVWYNDITLGGDHFIV